MPVNYSKWDNIEVSDDEDETHPNIEKSYLFRLRHQARVKRMNEIKEEKERAQKGKEKTREMLESARAAGQDTEELEEQLQSWTLKEEEALQKEKAQPLNIDTLSPTESYSKSRISKTLPQETAQVLDDDTKNNYGLFVEKYEDEIRKFGMMKRTEDSQSFLAAKPQLLVRFTMSYLNAWCVELVLEGKDELMKHVAYQAVTMQFILEVSAHAKMDIRAYAKSFFETRIARNHDPVYRAPFEDEFGRFVKEVNAHATRKRAEIKELRTREEKKSQVMKKFSTDYSKFDHIDLSDSDSDSD